MVPGELETHLGREGIVASKSRTTAQLRVSGYILYHEGLTFSRPTPPSLCKLPHGPRALCAPLRFHVRWWVCIPLRGGLVF